MANWNEAFNTAPDGTESPSEIDDYIMATRQEVRARMANQHTTYLEDSTGGTASKDFLHKEGWAQDSAPTITVSAAQDGALWWDTDDEELKRYDHATTSWVTIYAKEPIGTIKMFAGAGWVDSTEAGSWADGTLPGWHTCDGHDGTVDLVDKFILGGTASGEESTTNALATGAVSVTVEEENLPSHKHAMDITHYHALAVNASGSTKLTGPTRFMTNAGTIFGDHYTLTSMGYGPLVGRSGDPVAVSDGDLTETAATGSGTELDVTPPYYTLIFIQRRN